MLISHNLRNQGSDISKKKCSHLPFNNILNIIISSVESYGEKKKTTTSKPNKSTILNNLSCFFSYHAINTKFYRRLK